MMHLAERRGGTPPWPRLHSWSLVTFVTAQVAHVLAGDLRAFRLFGGRDSAAVRPSNSLARSNGLGDPTAADRRGMVLGAGRDHSIGPIHFYGMGSRTSLTTIFS
jgi:hypothetical protein